MSDPFSEYDGGEVEATPTTPTATTATTAAPADGHTQTPQPAATHGAAATSGPQPRQTLDQYLTALTGWSGNAGSPLLKSYPDLIRLRMAHRVQPVTEADGQALDARMEILAEATRLFEHGPRKPEIVRGTDDVERVTVAVSARTNRTAALQAAIACGELEMDRPLSFKAGTDAKIQAAFRLDDDSGHLACYMAAQLRKTIGEYALDFYRSESKMNPIHRAGEIKLELSKQDITPAEFEQLSSELIRLGSDSAVMLAHAESIKFLNRSRVIKEDLKLCASALVAGLKTLRTKAEADAIVFFCSQDTPKPFPTTSVVKQFNDLITGLESYSKNLSKTEVHNHPMPLNPEHLSSIFGVEVPGLV